VSEFVPGYESSAWYGIGAPRDTPAKIVEKLNKDINAGHADPNMKARLVDLGSPALAGSPADFGKLIAERNREVGQRHPGPQHQGGVRPIRCRVDIP
jgi:tripartite-type tricarboxylate transporter receptor subunit TctC